MTAGFPRILLAVLTVIAVQLASPLVAQAQSRVALVIGQSAYQKVVQLPNTANYATQMSKLIHIAFPKAGLGTLVGDEAPPASVL